MEKLIYLALAVFLTIAACIEHCSDEECVENGEEAMLFSSSAPGFRAAISSKGLDYISSLVTPMLKKELIKLNIPGMEDKADVKVAKVKYKFENIRVVDADIGTSSLQSDSARGLTLRAQDVALKVRGDWSYKSWAASDSGSVDVKVKGITIMVGVLIGADETGQFSLVSTSCEFRIGEVSVRFKGGASWLYNLFNSVVEKKIKWALEEKVCQMVPSTMKDSVSNVLKSFPVSIPVGKVAKLNNALIRRPSFTSQFLMTDHKGEFLPVSESSITDVHFFPSPLPPFPPATEPGRMVYLWVTDYMVNTAALVYVQAALPAYNVTPHMVGDIGFFKLDTNSFSHVVPELFQLHPDRTLTVGVRASDNPPKITITPRGAKLAIPGAVDFFITNEDALAFTLGIVVTLDIKAWIQEGSELLLKANATYDDAKVSVLRSNIGNIGEEAIYNFWRAASACCQLFLMPSLNKFTNEGVPIPAVKEMTFVNPQLTLGEGYILITTDFSLQK